MITNLAKRFDAAGFPLFHVGQHELVLENGFSILESDYGWHIAVRFGPGPFSDHGSSLVARNDVVVTTARMPQRVLHMIELLGSSAVERLHAAVRPTRGEMEGLVRHLTEQFVGTAAPLAEIGVDVEGFRVRYTYGDSIVRTVGDLRSLVYGDVPVSGFFDLELDGHDLGVRIVRGGYMYVTGTARFSCGDRWIVGIFSRTESSRFAPVFAGLYIRPGVPRAECSALTVAIAARLYEHSPTFADRERQVAIVQAQSDLTKARRAVHSAQNVRDRKRALQSERITYRDLVLLRDGIGNDDALDFKAIPSTTPIWAGRV